MARSSPDRDFRMIWEIDDKSQQASQRHRPGHERRDKLILATDPDREGEAISWHVLEVLKEQHALKKHTVERVVFNAITKQAVLDAMKHPGPSTGPWLTPISPAARSTTWSALPFRRCYGASSRVRAPPGACSRWRCGWSATASWRSRRSFRASIGQRETPATPRGDKSTHAFHRRRRRRIQRLDIGTSPEAEASSGAGACGVRGRKFEDKIAKRNAQPPFTTSTLQRAAAAELGFAAANTMRVAQQLYEGVDIGGETVGLITYMRTDGVDIAPEAIAAARNVIGADYGQRYLPSSPRQYQTKAKNARRRTKAMSRTRRSAIAGGVIKLIDRAKQRVLGIFRALPDGGGRLVPIDKKQVGRELAIAPGDGMDAQDGDLVAVEWRARPGRLRPRDRAREGKARLAHDRARRQPDRHPRPSHPARLPGRIAGRGRGSASRRRLDGREDWRELPLVTIDPADAKDHDDAVHAAPDADPANRGGFVVTVAIADVAAYVRPARALDREALERGNSVYFPDRVVPMLPERISNDLCSLRPDEDRAALAVRMVVRRRRPQARATASTAC